MTSQIQTYTNPARTKITIESEQPLFFGCSRQFPWDQNVKIIAPKIYIERGTQLSTQKGYRLSFECDEEFVCLGKVESARTKILAREVLAGRSLTYQCSITQHSNEEGKELRRRRTTSLFIITTKLYPIKSAEFHTQLATFRSSTPQWVFYPLFREEREVIYQQVIQNVVQDVNRKKRSGNPAAGKECGFEDKMMKKRKFK